MSYVGEGAQQAFGVGHRKTGLTTSPRSKSTFSSRYFPPFASQTLSAKLRKRRDEVGQGVDCRADKDHLKIQQIAGVKGLPVGKGRVENIRSRRSAEFGGGPLRTDEPGAFKTRFLFSIIRSSINTTSPIQIAPYA